MFGQPSHRHGRWLWLLGLGSSLIAPEIDDAGYWSAPSLPSLLSVLRGSYVMYRRIKGWPMLVLGVSWLFELVFVHVPDVNVIIERWHCSGHPSAASRRMILH